MVQRVYLRVGCYKPYIINGKESRGLKILNPLIAHRHLKSGMITFATLMRGHYRNQRQAFSNPSKWPQIDIEIPTPQQNPQQLDIQTIQNSFKVENDYE